MINLSIIQDAYYGVVGIRQPHNPAFAKLDASNVISRSGYFADDNSFCKVEYLYDNEDYKDLTDANFNTDVKNLQLTAIQKVLNEVFSQSDWIDRSLLFKFPLNKKNIETVPDGFVGYEISVANERNIAFKISRVILNFSETGTFKLMLFNSNENDPIEEKEITVSSTNQEVELNWILDNSGSYFGGNFYIGYISDGTLKPYKRDFENSSLMSCIRFLNIQGAEFHGHTSETMFDMEEREYSSLNYGLNFDISVYYDYTDLVLRNENLFANAINMAFQLKIMETYLSSLRSNRNERLSQGKIIEILAEIDGVTEGQGVVAKKGLKYLLIGEIKGLSKEIKRLQENYTIVEPHVITLT